jgi:hypothetical protein
MTLLNFFCRSANLIVTSISNILESSNIINIRNSITITYLLYLLILRTPKETKRLGILLDDSIRINRNFLNENL